jgi:ketosteroid isomerase-like protein
MAIRGRGDDARLGRPFGRCHWEGKYMTKAQDNVKLIRKGFEAFNKGDVATLETVLASDCVQHMPGNNRFSGDHKGLDNILSMYAEMGALTNGTLQAALSDVYAGDHHVTATYTAKATRNGATLDQRYALTFTIVDGKATDLDDAALDGDVNDAFWA